MLPKYFPASACLQLNSAHPVYQPDTASRPDEAIAVFKEFKAALDGLSRPVAIICKTATRASAVYAAYELVRCFSYDHDSLSHVLSLQIFTHTHRLLRGTLPKSRRRSSPKPGVSHSVNS